MGFGKGEGEQMKKVDITGQRFGHLVALYADETVPYKEIVRILNIANQNKFKMVLATRPQKK